MTDIRFDFTGTRTSEEKATGDRDSGEEKALLASVEGNESERNSGTAVRSRRRATSVKLIDVRPVESGGSLFPARNPLPDSFQPVLRIKSWTCRIESHASGKCTRPIHCEKAHYPRVVPTTDRCTAEITSI